MKEIWKKLTYFPNCDDYEVSNLGKIKKIATESFITKHTKNGTFTEVRRNPERILSQRTNGIEAIVFSDIKDNNRVQLSCYIHKVVGHEFIPKPGPEYTYVRHIDGDYLNNNVNNLYWATASETTKDTMNKYPDLKNQLKKINEKSGYYSKIRKPIDSEKLNKLFELRDVNNLTFKSIALELGMSFSRTYAIYQRSKKANSK